MMGIALDAGYALLALATAPWWMRKARGGWSERFGHIQPLPAAVRPRLLIHAVSVGEVNLTRPLVARMARDADVVLSTTTDTGIARARALYESSGAVSASAAGFNCRVVRFPLDSSRSVKRFLDAVRPDAVALAELELWPNFARACAARGIPLAVVNGRLSERSFKGYRLGRAFIGRYFAGLTFAAVQDDAYAQRFMSMGVARERCHIAGTMKWDAADTSLPVAGAADLARELGIDPSRPLVVAGSTEPGEPALLHRSLPEGVQLLCAPRKPEWFDEAQRDLPGCVRRTTSRAGATHDPATNPAPSRFLLDTIGELRKAYALADIVVVGRSFGQLYGSDPMEPAALGKPIIIGPRSADFATTVAAMLEDHAIIQTEAAQLPGVLRRLLNDPAARAAMGQRALECVRRHQGATERHAALLLPLLASRRSQRS